MTTDVGLEHPTGSTSSAKRHEVLWLKDGNVVLGTDVYLFKVHKSVLSMQSSVFRDMFAFPTAEDEDMELRDLGTVGMTPELYEGVHFVSLPDDGREMEHILRAVYERGYYDPHSNEGTLEQFTALLHLSCKYDFTVVRKDILGHLCRLYPTRLDEYDNVEKENQGMFGRFRPTCHMPLLKTAVEAGVDEHFPSLYYASSCLPAPYILNFFQKSPPHYSAMHRLFEGQEFLRKAIQNYMGIFIADTEHCICQHLTQFHGDPYVLAGGEIPSVFNTYNLALLSGENLLENLFPLRVCVACRGTFIEHLEEERADIWEEIPRVYRFDKTWGEIRAGLPTS